ncbi:unnamed protein product, partial [Rotaria magnacalcarata]
KLTSTDIDNRVCEQLCSFSDDITIIDSLFNEFNNSDLTGAINKSAFLCNLITQSKLKTQTVQKHPRIGNIYMLRQSVRKSFVLGSSASSSSNRRQVRPKKRPCLVWNDKEKQTVVLLLATFVGKDPNDDDVLPELSREYLMKYLLSIHPTPPSPGRRSIKLTIPLSMTPNLGEQINSYIILKLISVSEETVWSHTVDEYFSMGEMLYINDIVAELNKQETNRFIEKYATSNGGRCS